MADVEVNVSGNMEIPQSGSGNSFFQLPQNIYLSTPAAKEWIGQRRENVRPWTTFINTSNFKVPASIPRLSKRIMKNIEYFQSNYLFVFIGLIIYCLLTSPLLLIAVAISLLVGYKLSSRQNERKLTVLGHELTLAQQYGLVAICSIPLFIWAGAGAAVFWVIGASFFIITLHAAFFNIEAIVKSEDSFGLLEEV